MKILQTIQARLDQDRLSAAVAIVDAHGELIAFLRTDGCMLASIQIAINKAFTAARERRETGVIGEDARQRGYPITNYGDLRYVGWDGRRADQLSRRGRRRSRHQRACTRKSKSNWRSMGIAAL